MKSWFAQDAKGHFDEIPEACLADGAQVPVGTGDAVAMLVQAAELQAMTKPSLKDLLLSADARTKFLAPARHAAHARRAMRVLEAGQT
ncbi:prevent-host-death protein [Variovorax guangxiensis]|uniref:Prevent-host-death protein n=1 Tax=Variovorax guangxiensis TaxID=1775474 RepID=A0A433MEX2_9BURK|nr:prevent-host-death protein [Variovorax guangxiensis]RUR66393.1 prevent-host-death protein [Variovorax guangxiensis]